MIQLRRARVQLRSSSPSGSRRRGGGSGELRRWSGAVERLVYDPLVSIREQLLALEEGFWRAAGSRDAYAVHLADDAVHVFPGWGVAADDERVLAAVDEARPWQSFSIEEPRLVELGPAAAALVYTARARRQGQDEYVAAMTSVYRRTGDRWALVIHQQTPL
jgi:hypothetical protein